MSNLSKEALAEKQQQFNEVVNYLANWPRLTTYLQAIDKALEWCEEIERQLDDQRRPIPLDHHRHIHALDDLSETLEAMRDPLVDLTERDA